MLPQADGTGNDTPVEWIGWAEADREQADTNADGFLDSQRYIISFPSVQPGELLPVAAGLFGSSGSG